ncbi:MAG: hypothetical protein R3B48_21465 [Kofleriaceae bacterium]
MPPRLLALLLTLPLGLATVAAHAAPRTHDELYLRAGLGGGVALGALASPGGDSDSRGANVATELAVGWTFRPGLVLGVGTFPMVAPGPSYSAVDAGGQHTSATGPFVDYYFDPRGGLHAQGGLLFAAGYLDGGEREGVVGLGYGAMVGVGYDAFVTDQWSVGGLARVTASRLEGVDDHLSLASPSLLVTVTYH